MKLVLFFSILGLSTISMADTAPTRCAYGCQVEPQCESLAKDTEVKLFGSSNPFELWGVDVITANPAQPLPYQVESYGVPGTQANPGHLIFISYGYKDAKNPTGACRIEWIDQKCASCSP